VPNANAARQTPGNVTIDLTPGQERIEIDGYRLEQHVRAMSLSYSAQTRHPVLSLELLPSAVVLKGNNAHIGGELEDLLLGLGWRPPQ
jgi:hypothetical protein